MSKLTPIFDEINRALPSATVIDDLHKFMFKDTQFDIKLEDSHIRATSSIQMEVIAYVFQYGPHGESSQIRVTVGLGGVTYYSGVGIAETCFARMQYNLDLKLQSVDFYSKLT
jgi:hypothetical protein